MCKQKKHQTKEIDDCIKVEIAGINSKDNFKTILSCCGHSIYPKTIIVQNTSSGCVFDWISGIVLQPFYKNGKERDRFYRKDQNGYYFIPEVMLKQYKENTTCPECRSPILNFYNSKNLEGINQIGCIKCGFTLDLGCVENE